MGTEVEMRQRPGYGPRVLVIRCGAVGDTVLATCVLDPILARWPDARIEWLLTPSSASIFGADPRVAVVHRLQHRKLPIFLSGPKRHLLRGSRRDPFHLVLNLETADYFRRFAHALQTERVVGYGDGAEWLDRHGVENHRTVLAAAGLTFEGAMPGLGWREPEFTLPKRFVVLHPGNSHAGSAKVNIRAWPEARWRALCGRLVEAGVAVVVTGTPAEAALAARVAGEEALNLAGRTDVPALAGVLQRAALLVVSDTGPIHIGAAVGTPILGLYGPTRPTQTAPYGRAGQVRLLSHPLECSPCYGTPLHKSCQDNRCMQAITVQEVFEVVMGRIGPGESPTAEGAT